MINRLIYYFSSFKLFIQFQLGLRRRILEFYYRLLSLIKNKQNPIQISGKELSALFDIVNIPEKINICKDETKNIIRLANKTCSGIYNILGSGEIILDPIDWHLDFKSGYSWRPNTFFLDYKQENIFNNSDVKVPRELSRSHHLLHCGLAYKITGNEKYSSQILYQIIYWIDENPLMRSINWGCTMDVAIRAVNWIWALALIKDSKQFKKTIHSKIVTSLYEHGWYIYRNPEKSPLNNHNHYLSDLAGQIYLGVLLSNIIPEAKKWTEEGKMELYKELRYQILPSGMTYERSTNYNRLVVELLLFPILLLKQNGHEIPSDIWFRLEKMFEFIMYSLKPNGLSPVIGDQDNGRLLPFGTEELLDFRYLLSIGAILFYRKDFKYHSNGFNVYCALLCGENAKNQFEDIKTLEIELESKDFPDAGFFVMRNKDNYLIFNASGKGLYPELNTGTHTHSDLLSFELFIGGKTFISDSGSYIYTSDALQRMEFRSTMHHNTLSVDNISQNNISKDILWNFERNAIPTIKLWESNSRLDIIIASHNGYERLEEPINHKRTVIFYKNDLEWIIIDEINGKGNHKFDFNFHFDENIDFDIKNTNSILTTCDNVNIKMAFFSNSNFSLEKMNTYISKSYGVKTISKKLVVKIQSIPPVFLKTIITKV